MYVLPKCVIWSMVHNYIWNVNKLHTFNMDVPVVSQVVCFLCIRCVPSFQPQREGNVTHNKWTLLNVTAKTQYTGCPRRNVPEFGRVFLMLKYTDITQNTYVQSWTFTEIMAREKCGLLAGPRTVPVSWQPYPCQSLSVVSYYGNSAHAGSKLLMYFLLGDKAVHVSAWYSCHV